MAELITKEYVLAKLHEILENPEIKAKDRLVALKLAGDYLKMFGGRLEIDLRAIVAQLTSKELKGLKDAGRIKGNPTFEMEVHGGDYTPLIESGDEPI